MDKRRYEAVVLGGGLIGSAMALAFERHGIDVALIEQRAPEVLADPAFDGRAYAVSEGSANLLAMLGVWDAVAPDAEPVRRIGVSEGVPPAAGAPLHFDPAEAGRSELGWIVEDRHLRRALLRAVEAAAITRIAPAAVRSVTAGPMATVVDLRVDPGGALGGARVEAALAVACDGRRSPTARAAGIRYLGWPYPQKGLVTAIAHSADHGGMAHQSFFAGGPFAVLPLGGRRSSLVWSETAARAEALHALPDEALAAEIRSRIGERLGAVHLVGQRWLYPLGLALATSYVRPRLAVAGDSAHGVHPIAGQGLNMGLRDVAALTEVLVRARRRGEDIGATAALGDYERWRRFDATAMSLGMDAINRVFSNASGPLRLVRSAALTVAGRIEPVRRAMMNEAAGRAGAVPSLLTGRPI